MNNSTNPPQPSPQTPVASSNNATVANTNSTTLSGQQSTPITSINLPSGLILNSTPSSNTNPITNNQSSQIKILNPSSSIKINQIHHQTTAFTSTPASSSSGQVLPTIVTIPATILQPTVSSTPSTTNTVNVLSSSNSTPVSAQQVATGGTDAPGSSAAGTYGGFAYCSNCGEYGVKAAFYGKAKLYCSVACQNGIKKQNQQQQGVKRTLETANVVQTNSSGITIIPVNITGTGLSETSSSGDIIELKPVYSPGETQSPAAKRPRKQSTSAATAPVSSSSVILSPTEPKKPINGNPTVSENGHMNGKKALQSPAAPFHWGEYIDANGAEAAPVHFFKYAPLRSPWRHIIWQNMLVEVPSTNVPTDLIKQEECGNKQAYWFATVIGMAGYMLKVRYLGHSASTESSKEFWIHACDRNLHRVGWAAQHKQLLVPPSDIASKRDAESWINYIVETFEGVKALPRYFKKWVRESLEFRFKKNMRLEVLDKSQVSSMRVCRVAENVGGRIRVQYEGDDDLGDFWCHEASDLIHPVGWSCVVGHNINASEEYQRLSRLKYLHLKFAPDECPASMFKQHPPLYDPRAEFRVGMKLEAIDPCNPGVICPATVARVLKKNYLMIKIDGVSQNEAGLDMFCYHRNSTSIFPINFCKRHNIQLNPPYNYTGEFSWDKYLRETGAEFAPPDLFLNSADVHNPFRVGMKLESVDLMEPGMVCVATVKHVAGRLIKLTFDGWDQNYDQWVDFESCDLFPVGWCELVGYPLQEPPLKDLNASTGSKKNAVKSIKK